jgi:hypothetical protein
LPDAARCRTGPGFPLFAFEWPSLLVAVELLSWHLFFGLALLFAASGFQGTGAEAVVRTGLRVSGALCLAGLVGPALGDFVWRLPGVLGYGVVFPLLCLVIGYVFKRAASALTENDADLPQVAMTPTD